MSSLQNFDVDQIGFVVAQGQGEVLDPQGHGVLERMRRPSSPSATMRVMRAFSPSLSRRRDCDWFILPPILIFILN